MHGKSSFKFSFMYVAVVESHEHFLHKVTSNNFMTEIYGENFL